MYFQTHGPLRPPPMQALIVNPSFWATETIPWRSRTFLLSSGLWSFRGLRMHPLATPGSLLDDARPFVTSFVMNLSRNRSSAVV